MAVDDAPFCPLIFLFKSVGGVFTAGELDYILIICAAMGMIPFTSPFFDFRSYLAYAVPLMAVAPLAEDETTEPFLYRFSFR